MLTQKQIQKLKDNWGDKAECLSCNAEVRFFDPLSKWECYIYAINPFYEDEIYCIVKGFDVEASNWRMSELLKQFNEHGQPPQLDKEFRPMRASVLFKKLNEGEFYESRRNQDF